MISNATGTATTTDLQLSFLNVTQTFQDPSGEEFTAIKDVNLGVRPGEFISIVGPSGCGKSTLLNLTAGLISPTKGRVKHGGQLVEKINTDVGYVTQKDLLLPWRTVSKNISLALEIRGVPAEERKVRVAEILDLVGLTGWERHFPSQLSGGMRKRASLAQTLIYRPSTLLMDEPFGPLDAQLRLILQQQLLEICAQLGTTVLFVTHDLEEAVLLADRVVVFGTAPGRIIDVVDVPFGKDRDFSELRLSEEFRQIYRNAWDKLAPSLEVSAN